ncbi:MAG: hypothetical protein ROM03_01470 [Mucispirillum sp.]|nr:hypothetical protein [Mucispirillum sp.]
MYKKLLIFFLLSLQFLVVSGCSDRNSPEYAVNEIIKYYNNGDAVSFWNMVVPEERYAVSSNMAANIDNYDLFSIMSYALKKDNISPDNLSSEEYLYGSFKIILGDKDMEFASIEEIDDTTYSANVKLGEKYAVIPLKLVDGKWYMKIRK